MRNSLEMPYLRFELLPNGILVATYKSRVSITLEIAEEIVRTRLEFAGPEPRPVLIYNQGVVYFDKQARKYVSSEYGIAGVKAAAVVVDWSFTYLIMSYIFSVERPAIPVKTFASAERAMQWLSTYL